MLKMTASFILWTTILLCFSSFISAASEIRAQSHIIEVDGHPMHTATWVNPSESNKPWVVLISGPIDSWHSDTAWFAAAAPVLAETYRVITVDRAGLVNTLPNAPIGYGHFALDLAAALHKLEITDATLVAFASGNLTAVHMLQNSQQALISSMVLIDPDVLTPYSIARYASDAAPFKDNLEKYLSFIGEGKYVTRVEQKNQADMKILRKLSAEDEADWDYVTSLMNARLKIANQQNLFREIAYYHQDLTSAASLTWPANVPTLIIDSDFEQDYIDSAEDEKSRSGLAKWRQDGKKYYQQLAGLSANNQYLEISSRAHLFQFEQPQRLLSLINSLRQTAR